MTNLTIEASVVIERNTEICKIKVIKALDEYFQWDDVKHTFRPIMHIDLSDVKKVNSIGIRQWSQKPKCPFQGRKALLFNVPHNFLSDPNVAILLNGTLIVSFSSSFTCKNNRHHSTLISYNRSVESVKEFKERTVGAPCIETGCSGTMDLDSSAPDFYWDCIADHISR